LNLKKRKHKEMCNETTDEEEPKEQNKKKKNAK